MWLWNLGRWRTSFEVLRCGLKDFLTDGLTDVSRKHGYTSKGAFHQRVDRDEDIFVLVRTMLSVPFYWSFRCILV